MERERSNIRKSCSKAGNRVNCNRKLQSEVLVIEPSNTQVSQSKSTECSALPSVLVFNGKGVARTECKIDLKSRIWFCNSD